MRICRFLGAAAVALALFTGCGDYGDKTQTEQGIEAVDSQQWELAIEIFSALPKSELRDKYLSSAYAGAAGLDLLKLAVAVSEAQDAGQDTLSVAWGVAADLMDADPLTGLVALADLNQKIDYLTRAVEVYIPDFSALEGPVDIAAYGLTDKQKFQISLETIILSQYKIVAGLVYPEDDQYAFADPQALKDYLDANFLSVDAILQDPSGTMLDNLVALVQEGVLTIEATTGDGNDVATEMQNFLDNLGYAGAGLTTQQVIDYLDQVLSGLPTP